MTSQTNTAAKFYLIESQYVGPNQNEEGNLNRHSIGIYTTPARGNSGGEPVIAGWAGTTNDVSVNAHGEYDTLEAAQAAIAGVVGEVRDGAEFGDCLDDDIVESYLVGKHTPMGKQSTGDWAFDSFRSDITADTTTADIEMLAAEYQDAANEDGFILDSSLEAMMIAYRDDLIDARNEA